MGKLKLKLLDLEGFGEIDAAEPNFCNLIVEYYRDYIESRKLRYPVKLKHSEAMIFPVFAGPSLGSKTVVLRSGIVTLGALVR